MHRFAKVIAVFIIAISAILIFRHISSQNFKKNSLEKALGLMHLPKSAKISNFKHFKLIDEEVEGSVEISPKEFPILLSGRKFVELPISSKIAPIHIQIPPHFVPAKIYKWTDGGDIDCIVRCDSTSSMAIITYCNHWR